MNDTPKLIGLTGAEARHRLAREGYNELARQRRRTPFRVALDVIREPMFGLLLVAGAIYLALGDLRESLVLLAFATVSISIAVVQESRTERVLESLRDLTSPRALVLRDGQWRRIPGREVVRGDHITLSEGDRVPADATLISCHDLKVDESLLTGESIPVRKLARDTPPETVQRPGGDDTPDVFSGTLIVRGQGVAVVHATGRNSEIGKIGRTLGEIEMEPPRLALQTRLLVRIFAIAGLILSVMAILVYGLLRGDWLAALLGGIALSMSLLPEEFPLVLTVFMAMGAWRISRARVLTRRASAIESLGAATVLCTDKTGTLTQNRMTVAELRSGDSLLRPTETDPVFPPGTGPLLEYGILASEKEPLDPMEAAFHELGRRLPAGAHRDRAFKLVHKYGLRPDLLAVSHVWRRDGSEEYVVAAKGAPEAIAGLCRLDAAAAAAIRKTADEMAAKGLRVLGVARSVFTGAQFPETQKDFDFEFLGLVGLADPLRPSVPRAIKECRAAGIRVIMITGDYPVTARTIATEAGLIVDHVITGSEIAGMTDGQLAAAVRTATVFARIMPEQKLRIVNALKTNGEIVAMTGDGVNDAPALKAAHIGIAMGGRGTDVAREASSIVLLDDDFASIVKTIRLGRRIYDNLRKAMGYIFAVHVPIAGLALLPLAFGWPLILAPIHIAFLEMVIDPVCSIVFEAEKEENNVMRRAPRAPDSPMFNVTMVAWCAIQGGFAFLIVAAIYALAIYRGLGDGEVRTLAFVSLVLVNFGLILVNRSFGSSLLSALLRPNVAFWVALGVTLSFLGAAVAWPTGRDLFQFGPIQGADLALSLAAIAAVVILLELPKYFWRARLQS